MDVNDTVHRVNDTVHDTVERAEVMAGEVRENVHSTVDEAKQNV